MYFFVAKGATDIPAGLCSVWSGSRLNLTFGLKQSPALIRPFLRYSPAGANSRPGTIQILACNKCQTWALRLQEKTSGTKFISGRLFCPTRFSPAALLWPSVNGLKTNPIFSPVHMNTAHAAILSVATLSCVWGRNICAFLHLVPCIRHSKP